MKNKKTTKVAIAKKLKISHSAIVQWVTNKHIPAQACIDLEPILNVGARELQQNPNILFNMFDGTAKEDNKAIINE